MKVKQILQAKGSNSVETISADAALMDAVASLSSKRIGALVVVDSGGTVEGIISERDIVRRLGQGGAAALEATVSDIMTSPVVTCTPDESADDVLGRMTDGRFRHVPVMRNDQMIGLVSIGDVVKARIEAIEAENAAMAEMLSH